MRDRVTRARNIFEADGEPSGEPDRYHCLLEIGRGGMAVVYRAWDSHMNREVALKVAREEVAGDPDIRRRFEEESRIAGTFSHPNILPVFDRGLYQGRPYLAIQLIDGAALDRADLPLREKLAHLATAAEAVEHAHARGVIHRDLKPSNILLGRDNRVYLTDFGVARQTVSEDRRTAAGTVVGTPAYMSPEQARGEDVDARADIYALGATLYELAVGRPPYEGADPQAVLEAVRTRPPPAPRKANSKVSRNVESIIRMAMERLPRDRYASAQAMADDLRLYQNHRRPLARARGFRYYVGREIVRHPVRTAARFLTALIVAGALTVGSLVGGGWLEYRRALVEKDQDRRIALLEEASAYYPPARRRLKELRAELAAAERRRLERMRELENRVSASLDQGDFETAATFLEELTGLDGASVELLRARYDRRKAEVVSLELVASLRRLLAAGDLEGAAEAMKRLPPAHPERDGLLERLRQGRFAEGARTLLKAATEGEAGRFQPLFDELASPAHAAEKNRDAVLGGAARKLGLALWEKRDRAGTVRWLSEAERRDIEDADLYRTRGLARLVEKNWDAAQRDLEALRLHAPGTPTPSEYWALFHLRAKEAVVAGRWLEAQSQLSAALGLPKDPKDEAVLRHDLGLVRWKTMTKAQVSLGDLEAALLLNPGLKPDADYVPIVLSLARARVTAAPRLETSAERDALWKDLLARVDLVAGRPEERPEELRVLRASLLRKLRQVTAAFEELATAGNSARVRLARARVHVSEAARPEAREGALTRAYEEVAGARLGSPDDPAVLAWKALLGPRLDRPQAIAAFQAAQARGGLFPAARLEHARLLQGDAALKELELATAEADLGEDDLLWLGAEPHAKPLSLVKTEFRRAGLLLRAYIRFGAKDMSGCVGDATLLLDEAPSVEARRLRGLARIQLPKPDCKGVAEDLEPHLLVQPDDPHALLALASAYLGLDRDTEAEAHCSTVIQKWWPNAPEPYYLRGLARKSGSNAVGRRSDFDTALRLCPLEHKLRPKILEQIPR
jgi:tetratricopeptide (TPR) repeat protein/predicted Ser/Thr protein kinase